MAVLFCNKLALRSSLTYRPLYLHCWVCVSLGSVGKMANYKEHEPMEEKSYQKISKEALTLQSMLLVLWIPNRFTAPWNEGRKRKIQGHSRSNLASSLWNVWKVQKGRQVKCTLMVWLRSQQTTESSLLSMDKRGMMLTFSTPLPVPLNHYDFNTDKVCNSLRIQVLVDTCAMSTWITEGQ